MYSCFPTVWDPFTQANKTKLEKIQRHFARFILNDYQWTSSVTAMHDPPATVAKPPGTQSLPESCHDVQDYKLLH